MLPPKRTRKKPIGKRRIMPRDQRVLRFIANMQPVTTHMVCLQELVSHDIGRRILRKLRDFGFIKVWITAMEEQNRYTITKSGAKYLQQSEQDTHTYYIPRQLLKGVTHHDGSVLFGISLMQATQTSTVNCTYTLERSLRAKLGQHVTSAQVPDAVALLETHHQRMTFAIEVDTGSESPSWVSTHKAKPYQCFQEQGTPLLSCTHWAVLCLVPSIRRIHQLVTRFYQDDALPIGVWFFAIANEISPKTVLQASTWNTLHVSAQQATLTHVSPFEVFTNEDVFGQ